MIVPDNYPTNPTDGWMLSELEKWGSHLRGKDWKPEGLRKILIELGYSKIDVVKKTKPKSQKEDR